MLVTPELVAKLEDVYKAKIEYVKCQTETLVKNNPEFALYISAYSKVCQLNIESDMWKRAYDFSTWSIATQAQCDRNIRNAAFDCARHIDRFIELLGNEGIDHSLEI